MKKYTLRAPEKKSGTEKAFQVVEPLDIMIKSKNIHLIYRVENIFSRNFFNWKYQRYK
jgi:hypothetical protein